MKVLVVGGGAREHALSWKLSQSRDVERVYCLPGNAGTAEVAENLSGRVDDLEGIVRAAAQHGVDFVVVGPEDPLVRGLVDQLEAQGVSAFGPSQAAAQLEGSKAFSKELMREAGVPTAAFEVFTDPDAAAAYVKEQNRTLVVKADGLAAGKGVVVASTQAEALAAVDAFMRERVHGAAGDRIVIEDCLVGQEVSYHVVCDGERYVALSPAQDHKRVGEGDTGPNTGGMGAYSPPPVVTAEVERRILREVVEPTLKTMRSRGTPFKGTLFVGLMIDHAGRPSVLEYNVRFGDPETEAMLMRWDGDLLPLLTGSARGDLSGVTARWSAPCALCVVMASRGYPGPYPKGVAIHGLDHAEPHAVVFHAGTTRDAAGAVVTSGGRVLTVTATGETVDEASARAYALVDKLSFDGAHYRRDIGHHARSR